MITKSFVRLVLTIVLFASLLQNSIYAQVGTSEVHKGPPILTSTKTVIRSIDGNNESDRIGLFGGYDILRHIVEFRTIGNFPSCCPGYNQKTDGNGFATGLFYQLSFGDMISFDDNLQLRVAYRSIGANFSQEEYLGRVRNLNDSVLVDAYSSHTFKSTSSFITFEPRFSIKPMKLPLHLSIGFELGYAAGDMKFSQNEQLTRPSGLVFKDTDNSINRNTITDSIIDKSIRNAFIIPGITLGMGLDIPLSSTIKLSPEVTYYLPLTLQQSSLLKPIVLNSTTVNTPWRFGNLRLGASLSIALGSRNKIEDIYDSYLRRDTTTIYVPKEEKETIVLDYTKTDTVTADRNHFIVTIVEHYTHYKATSSTIISDNLWVRKVQVDTIIEYSTKYYFDSTVHIGIVRYDTTTPKTITAVDQYINFKPPNSRKPDSTYTLDNITYWVFINRETISKVEKGRTKDSTYQISSKSVTQKSNDPHIVIVNTYTTYMRITPCPAETCPPYFAWDYNDCTCTERVSPNKIVFEFLDAYGKAAPDTIFTTRSRNSKIRYIYPAVFFINSSDESLPRYDRMPPKDKIFDDDEDNYFDKQLLPLNVVALRAQQAQGKDTIVLIGYDDVRVGDSKRGKDLGKERASILSSYLTKSRLDNGPGISPNCVVYYSIHDEKFKSKKKFRLPGDIVPDIFETDINSGKQLRSRVEIYGSAATLLRADTGSSIVDPRELQEKILSPYSIVVRAIPGNNNASLNKGPISIELKNIDLPNTNRSVAKKVQFDFIDSATALRTIVLKGNQPRKAKDILIESYYTDTTAKKSEGYYPKIIPQKSLTPSERQARGFVDTITTEISFMLPFFCDKATPDDATEPPTQYEKRVLNEIKARILPSSLVEIQYSSIITPEHKVKRLAELLGAVNAKFIVRPPKDPKKLLDTYNANDFVWEGRFKVTIKTPD